MKTVNVTYQSVWEEGIIETNAKLHLESGVVVEIEQSEFGSEYESWVADFIIYDGKAYAVSYDGVHGEYYINLVEFMLDNPKLYIA